MSKQWNQKNAQYDRIKKEALKVHFEGVQKMVSRIKKNKRSIAKIMKAYSDKKFGKGINEFGQKYNTNYLEGIIQALEFTLFSFGYDKANIATKKDLDNLIERLEKQGEN